MTRAESDALLDAIQAHWGEHGFGLWCAAPREDPDACLGFIGLAVPSFLPAVLPAVEVGWRLARPEWGRGLATEGARASLRYGFETLRLRSVVSIIAPANTRSIRVAEKLGMRRGASHLHPGTRQKVWTFEISSEDAGFSPGPS
jgi:RimJ/RimL family protein N-acetyltransferase